MPTPFISFFFTIFTLSRLLFCFQVCAVPYDYSYTHGCVPKSKPPQYSGGVVKNPEFDEGVNGWKAAGDAKIQIAKSPEGHNYVVVSNRNADTDGVFQTINVEKDKFYTVSAWVQISKGTGKVHATLKTADGDYSKLASWITAESGCWKMIKGGLSVNATGPADLHIALHDNTTGIDVWVDSVSVQPFTQKKWISHQDESREKLRKSMVKFQAVDENGKPVANAVVSIHQRRPNFPWGNAMNDLILTNPTYQKWFLDRFQYTVFENELKWSYTEKIQGAENYTIPDAMLQWAKSNKLTVRGHNILWDDMKFQAEWVKDLKGEALKAAAVKRVNSVVSRYKGHFIHWDVINENMHFDFLSSLAPRKFDSDIFNLVHQLDPAPLLFLNEYAVIPGIGIASPAAASNYLDKIAEIRSGGYSGPLGIGIQGHFFAHSPPNIPYTRAVLDIFASTGLPVWITELDVNLNVTTGYPPPVLEMVLHELHSHPAVEGILMWASMGPTGRCFVMCMTDLAFKNTVAGDIVDKFISEFIKVADTNGTTDANGVFEASLFHGEYEARVSVDGAPSSAPQTFNLVAKGDLPTVELAVSSDGAVDEL